MIYLCNAGMFKQPMRVIIILYFTAIVSNLPAIAKKGKDLPKSESGLASVVLWSPPSDIRDRNLFFGPGGKLDQPETTFTFVKEDLDGTSPKFYVRDQNGTKWKVKLGPEAQSETVATRLVWAVGYRVDEDYYLPVIHVKNMPTHLGRGQKWAGPEDKVRGVRLERYLKGEKKVGQWDWRSNPFIGTRELNGLRVMMALMNNWDVKDENNAIYDDEETGSMKSGRHLIYLVSDLGASFGGGGRGWTLARSKNNLEAYRRSKFIRKARSDYVDFNVPAKPPLLFFLNFPEFILNLQTGWVCRHIPREDVQWIGHVLAQLSLEQVHDAFRAAGYTPEEVKTFSSVVHDRIVKLNDLSSEF